jgi:hypothetical protein
MGSLGTTSDNLLINGRFLRALWMRLAGAPEGEIVPCPVWAQTFAADRWRVRYAAPAGGEVSQARSVEVPDDEAVESSLEIRGGVGVEQAVLVGQNIEAEEAPNYRRPLRFSAWVLAEHPRLTECDVSLVMGSPTSAGLFDSSTETVLRHSLERVGVNRWTRVEHTFDAADFRNTGLRAELEFPADFLSEPRARVRIANVRLSRITSGGYADRPVAVETFLAGRFFQRHDGTRVNAIGRALTSNPHELHFQFLFPEMRAIPACSISQDNADLCVFSAEGVPQTGFAYDVNFSARGSVMIRATKPRHQIRDGYLAFRGYRGEITLEAEL